MSRPITFAMLLFIGFLGCKANKPIVTDLAGTWVLTSASRDMLPLELQKASGVIVLNPDGNFTATDLPLLFWSPDKPPWPASGVGSWKIIASNGEHDVQLTFESVSGGEVLSLPYGTKLHIARDWLKGGFVLSYMQWQPIERPIELRRK